MTHACWADANVQVQTEALTEAEAESLRKAQAKRAVKRPREGEAAVSSDAPGTKTGQTRDARKEGRRDGGQQKAQRQDEAGHRRGGKTRSQAKMVDRNNGSAERVSLSDIFSSSGALPFSDELKDPGVFIPERASADEGGTRRGMTDDEESGGQQVFQMRKRSRTISVPRSGETGREDGRAMHRNRGRARTMNVQRHVAAVWGEPSRHRTLPCQCEKCAADRASQHPTGEINEWGDTLLGPARAAGPL